MAEPNDQDSKPVESEVEQDHQVITEEQPENQEQGGEKQAESEAEEAAEVSDADHIATLQAELNKAKDESLRIQAEMQNLRRRTERDVEHAHKFALEKFVRDLLPVVDNLERAIATINPADDAQKAIGEGVELTLKSFVDLLTKFDVDPIDPKGAAFDPELHQAMSMLPSAEVSPNTVLEVFQKGYTLNGRLVRPAMVVVAKAAEG